MFYFSSHENVFTQFLIFILINKMFIKMCLFKCVNNKRILHLDKNTVYLRLFLDLVLNVQGLSCWAKHLTYLLHNCFITAFSLRNPHRFLLSWGVCSRRLHYIFFSFFPQLWGKVTNHTLFSCAKGILNFTRCMEVLDQNIILH